jgi:hypothetical protein
MEARSEMVWLSFFLGSGLLEIEKANAGEPDEH